jgi:lysophospholipase L1-like esterase
MCPGLTPIACEYSQVRPSFAIIMIGTNDVVRGIDRGAYGTNLARIIETSLQYGVIPVLSTIPHNSGGDAQAYNAIIISTAEAYDIPWMDFYAATVNLPNHGNDPDGIHPSVPPTNDPTNFTQGNLQYGHTVRNLLALHLLDALWRQVLAP